MRELFISERRYIDNILWKWTKARVEPLGPLVIEDYSPPQTKSGVRFNNDYTLWLVSQEAMLDIPTKSFCASVLQNTLGSYVFLTVDERTLEPLRTELLDGEGFEMRYFKEHIEKIEEQLASLSCPIKLRRTKYCRIFVIENDICFLAFPDNQTPDVRGDKKMLCSNENATIACATDENKVVYIDGWIRTHVPESEWKLEAIPVESSDELPEGLLAIDPTEIDNDDDSNDSAGASC